MAGVYDVAGAVGPIALSNVERRDATINAGVTDDGRQT